MKRFICLFALVWGVMACSNEPQSNLSELNLLEYGLPITVQAPDSAQVKKVDMGSIMKDVTIKYGEDYSIQLYASQATTNDIAKLKAEKLSDIKMNPFFSKIVREEESGFIFETIIDSTTINYGFNYAYVQGDMEYIFSTGLIGTFTLEEVEKMYDAVKQK